MKYFEVTTYTPFCGEELVDYIAAESEEEICRSGQADELITDCIHSYMDPSEYEENGFESAEEWEEYYYEGSGVNIVEITKEHYEKERGIGW